MLSRSLFVRVLQFKSWASALAAFTQQVLIDYLVMRHPLCLHQFWLGGTVITLFSFIAVHRLLCFSWWLRRRLLDTQRNSTVNCIVANTAVNTRSDHFNWQWG